MKDTAIKLFGKKISFPDNKTTINHPLFPTATATAGEESGSSGSDHDQGLSEEERVSRKDSRKDQLKEQDSEAKYDEKSVLNPKIPCINEDNIKDKPAKTETEANEPKTLKKPDKILPCPRCNSMDTKFCYYNNYNVNQPRHFCKSCQRYWTAGGTMRNMPVGAGRRKNKNPASQCQLATISQETAAVSDGVHAKVLNFGSDSPRVDGFQVSCRGRENGDDCSSGSTVTTSNSATEKMHEKNGFFPQVPCIQGVSWSYNPWNSAICPTGYPTMPIYPSPYWNYIHWLPIQNQKPQHLGKHSRDSELTKPNDSDEPKRQNNSVLTPKTLRINDPDEAAKSSIWATLGIKNENVNRGGLFKAFQAKGEENTCPSDINSPVLHANPAAFSRSICFQERA